jgi:hypothetical protein
MISLHTAASDVILRNNRPAALTAVKDRRISAAPSHSAP